MKRASGLRKTASNLSESVQQHLNMYALAAGAAGVGLLALAQPAEGRIVYTKTHQVIGANGVYNLDLNHDGIVDFLLQQIGYCNSTTCYGFQRWLLAKEALGNAVQGSIGNRSMHFASALKLDAPIGPHQHFISGGNNGETMIFVWQDQDLQMPYTYGKWINLNNRYLGLKFKIGRKTHYGWARLSVHNQVGNITGTLTGYAYETIPNKPIMAGKTKGPDDSGIAPPDTTALARPAAEPATLGLIAKGASGLVAWRREKTGRSKSHSQRGALHETAPKDSIQAF